MERRGQDIALQVIFKYHDSDLKKDLNCIKCFFVDSAMLVSMSLAL